MQKLIHKNKNIYIKLPKTDTETLTKIFKTAKMISIMYKVGHLTFGI